MQQTTTTLTFSFKNMIKIHGAYKIIWFWGHFNDECVISVWCPIYIVAITQAEVPSSHIGQWVTQAEAHGPATT